MWQALLLSTTWSKIGVRRYCTVVIEVIESDERMGTAAIELREASDVMR